MSLDILNYDEADEKRKAVVDMLKKNLGNVPNIFMAMAHSPAVVNAFLAFKKGLSKGSFSEKEMEAISLVVGQHNNCEYCVAAHTAIAKGVGFTEEETVALRTGKSSDPKLAALVQLAKSIVITEGCPAQKAIDDFYAAGYDKTALVEVIALVSLNIFTNYFNHIADLDIDFPQPPTVILDI